MDFCSRTGMWGLCCLAMMQNWAMTTIQTPSVPGSNFPLETFQSSQIWKFSCLSQMQNSCNPSSLQQLIRVRSVQIPPTWSMDNSGGGGSGWERLRSPPLDTPAHDLYLSDCHDKLQPGDHVEVQWCRNKDFSYGNLHFNIFCSHMIALGNVSNSDKLSMSRSLNMPSNIATFSHTFHPC